MSYRQFLLALPLLSDAAQLSADSQAGSMPASYLQLMQPTDVWRATSLSGAVQHWNLLSPQLFNLVWLGYTNASSAATIQVRASNTLANLPGSPAWDSGVLSHWPVPTLAGWKARRGWTHGYVWLGDPEQAGSSAWPTVTPYQYVHVTISDPTNPDGYYQAGRSYISLAWRPTYDLKPGWSLKPVQGNQIAQSQSGPRYIVPGAIQRQLDGTIQFLDENELFSNFFEDINATGEATDVLVIRNPGDPLNPTTAPNCHRQMIYGTITGGAGTQNSEGGVYDQPLSVLELL